MGRCFKNKEIEDSKYDKIFVDLNDDQYCIDQKKHERIKRILKHIAQVGSFDKKSNKWIIGAKFYPKVLEMLNYLVLIYQVLTVTGILLHL